MQLETRRERVPAGRTVALRGFVASPDPQCSTNQRVKLRRRVHGTGPRYHAFRRVMTNDEARFSIDVRARQSADYLAVVAASTGCRKGVSNPVQVLAMVRITVRVDDATPARFSNFRIHGRLLPKHVGTRVILERKRGETWRRYRGYRQQRLARGSSFSYFVDAKWSGARVFRIRWRKADHDHEANASRSLSIRTHS